jgi:hypothetical protein
MRFFNDLAANATGPSSFVTNCLVKITFYIGVFL